MDELYEIAKIAGGGGIVVATIFGLAKAGLLKLQIGKNGNNYQKQIDELHEHAKTSNEEVGKIREDISQIKEDLAFIKGKFL